MSNYGWTYLSRTALRRAGHQLSGEGEGVRDEIGFLILHKRYADHFFPGTSVLHTRLRYALSVPWIYQTLHEERARGPFRDRLKEAERKLTYQVEHDRGAIGRDTYPEPPDQPAGERYWAALGAWGILREMRGRLPSRAQVHAQIEARPREARDDDGQPLGRVELPFIGLPPPGWLSKESMEFTLPAHEREFLYRVLTELSPKGAPGEKGLLAKLSAGPRIEAETCWAEAIVEAAGRQDGARMRRAAQAASLTAVEPADAVADDSTPEEDDESEQILVGLHAKIFAVLRRKELRLWVGSANATERAWNGGNVEVMAEVMRCPRSSLSKLRVLRRSGMAKRLECATGDDSTWMYGGRSRH